MGECSFCGKSAGFLRSAHKECQVKYDSGVETISELLLASAKGKTNLETTENEVRQIAASSFVYEEILRQCALKALELAVDYALDDDLLTEEEERAIDKYKTHFGLSPEQVSSSPAYVKLVKAGVLREIFEGKIPDRVNIVGDLPVNFQKSEQLIWVFNEVEYLQPRTRTTYEGASRGVSLRIVKGVYYRTGQFKGRPVQQTSFVTIDNGILALTNKHLYFAGTMKSLRVPYSKIVTFQPYSDGLAINRGLAKPDVFITGDGWFTYNLVSSLASSRL